MIRSLLLVGEKIRAPVAIPSYEGCMRRYSETGTWKGERKGEEVNEGGGGIVEAEGWVMVLMLMWSWDQDGCVNASQGSLDADRFFWKIWIAF